MHRLNLGVEDVFESGKLGDGFLQRGFQNFVRCPLGDDPSPVEDQNAFSQGKDLVATVGDVKNRDAVCLVPSSQIIHDSRFRGGIERGERFVQQQNFGICHQSASQCDALTFSAGDLFGMALSELKNAK